MKAASWIAVAILIAGLGVLGGVYLDQNTTIDAVEFRGNYFTDDADLLGVIESPEGQYADSIDYRAMFSSLRSLPYVDDVSLGMSRRGTLTFTITEREPLGLLMNGSDRTYFSEGGIPLPRIPGKTRDVPLVYGFSVTSAADTLQGDAYRQIESFLTSARDHKFGWVTISEVTWNEREGVVALSHENGVKLVFGHENYKERLRNWKAFYREVISRRGMEAFSTVDLRFRDQIVTRES
jgi:cell division protein FtsQ